MYTNDGDERSLRAADIDKTTEIQPPEQNGRAGAIKKIPNHFGARRKALRRNVQPQQLTSTATYSDDIGTTVFASKAFK